MARVPKVAPVRQEERRVPIGPSVGGAQSASGVTFVKLDDDESTLTRHELAIVPLYDLQSSE